MFTSVGFLISGFLDSLISEIEVPTQAQPYIYPYRLASWPIIHGGEVITRVGILWFFCSVDHSIDISIVWLKRAFTLAVCGRVRCLENLIIPKLRYL